jgi:glycosyltransferase involved in cell wall biosynthesis
MEFRLYRSSGKPLNGVVERKRRSAAIIPCFNEAGTIGEVVRETARRVEKVWVINDGSLDRTAEVAQQAGAVVLRNEMNLGKGAALRRGFEAVAAEGFEWVFTLDGDGQHDPLEMDRFCKDADLVVGDRSAEMKAMSWVRRFVNRWTSARVSRRVGFNVPDSQCGFRLIRVEALKKVVLRENKFAIENEIIVAFAEAGLRIEFVPVSVKAAKRASRIHPLADTWRWFRWWWR